MRRKASVTQRAGRKPEKRAAHLVLDGAVIKLGERQEGGGEGGVVVAAVRVTVQLTRVAHQRAFLRIPVHTLSQNIQFVHFHFLRQMFSLIFAFCPIRVSFK